MLHAATMLLGLWIILLLATLPATTIGVAQAGLSALLVTALALRTGGASHVFTRLPRTIAGSILHGRDVMVAALASIRAALAADVTLSPALVRIRLGANDGLDEAEAVARIGAASGLAVVAFDPSSLLAHALNEDSVDVARVRARLAEGVRT